MLRNRIPEERAARVARFLPGFRVDENEERGYTGSKSYLRDQINLISLSTTDLFTDEEYVLYERIVDCINAIEREDRLLKEDPANDPAPKKEALDEKRACQIRLAELISAHEGTPREVNLRRVLDTRRLPRDEEGQIIWPEGVSWKSLRVSKKITEFLSEESRCMGLKAGDTTTDKIILKWKSLDILRNVTLDGFDMNVLMPDNTVIRKHYIVVTASAGQLRTDKVQCMEESIWERCAPRLMCGLTFGSINEMGGINLTKLMAYLALGSGATEAWDYPIEKCIVIEDFEAPVEGVVDFVYPDYTIQRGIREAVIKHTDGCGMMLPRVSRKNFMVRGPWLKGMLASFDYLRFCRVNGCEPKLTDIWGQEHDLEKEDIGVVFTKSQFKLYSYYKNWDDYKEKFKANGCTLCRTNYEEDYIPDTTISYQMLQTLTGMTDEEISALTRRAHDKIMAITRDGQAMLRALGANRDSEQPYRRVLAAYPELLREAYSKETLKSIKSRWILDAKSGRLLCRNKRLFAIPDLYAACQYWFLNEERPEGLLSDGRIACKPFRAYEEVDCLRSPHLYMEHAIRNVVRDQEIYDWFYTDGVYTSCHDLISKILQFDVDGDQLNIVGDRNVIEAAKREIEEKSIVPLLYDMGSAGKAKIDRQEIFAGLKRAHDYSGIGQVSNALTKLWNRENPDRWAAACLTFYNNLVIDAAKTGVINGYENYPEARRRILRAIGGKNGRMPWFFQFSKNGRRDLHLSVAERKKVARPNNSTMNRICAKFDDIGNINMYKAGVPPFNWQMLLIDNDKEYNIDAVRLFCALDDGNQQNLIAASRESMDADEIEDAQGYEFVKELIVDGLIEMGGLESAYPSIVKFLFAGDNGGKATHKQMFWRVFGELAEEAVMHNLETYTVCERCGTKLPAWSKSHDCAKDADGFFECAVCGCWVQRKNSKQCRCEECQKKHRKEIIRAHMRAKYVPKKKKKEAA